MLRSLQGPQQGRGPGEKSFEGKRCPENQVQVHHKELLQQKKDRPGPDKFSLEDQAPTICSAGPGLLKNKNKSGGEESSHTNDVARE
ncbi:hypothetical protein TNCT_428591 [Trichonephila clavata]|uniref:Uncharacterized protein n=1 Tax=Trichonephila clavata TaxID=2740835 RepID=A0A8X6HBV9_TRICU|nr:hypothetical protein TNCT_428591 [Trichonephila clavata]